MLYTDSHVHLQNIPSLAEVLRRAEERGVRRFFCNGTEPSDWSSVSQISKMNTQVVPFFGLHPWFVEKNSQEQLWIPELQRLVEFWTKTRNQPCGIGEIGLDQHLAAPGTELAALQEKLLRTQLRLAKNWNLPISIHSVHAMQRLVPILHEEGPFTAILFHAFAGPYENKRLLEKMNVFFSFSGAILDQRQRRVREAAQNVPIDRIVLETDAPTPIFTVEPALIPDICNALAVLRNVPEQEMAEIVHENDRSLFRCFMDCESKFE